MRGLTTIPTDLANKRLGFWLLFVFYLHNNKIQQIKVIFNRFLRFAMTWRLHYSKTGEARHDFALKRIKSHA